MAVGALISRQGQRNGDLIGGAFSGQFAVMATREQIADWQAGGRAVRQQRETRETYGDRPADEIKRLREAAAESAACCADCFALLAPNQSVTLTTRAIEHVAAQYNYSGKFIRDYDRTAAVPICLSCWLTDNVTPPAWLIGLGRGERVRHHAEVHAEPVPPDWRLQRLRCEGCGRPLRVESKRGRRLPLRERCCCALCLHKATLKRANERRRVRHAPIACVVCRKKFVPKQSTAKTCSNKCRQALHRRRQRARHRTRARPQKGPAPPQNWPLVSVLRMGYPLAFPTRKTSAGA
jgi:hypothetical protein